MDFHFLDYNPNNINHQSYILHLKKNMFKLSCTWFVYFDTVMTIKDVLKEFDNLSLNLDDDFIVALNQSEEIVLWELYRIVPNSPIQNINVGQWTTSKGLNFTKINKRNRRSNLLGYNLRITTLVEAPYNTKIKLDSMTKKYHLEGSFADLLNLYAKILNFTYTYVPPPDNAWGSLQEDGSWNGMMNLVHNKSVDIGMCIGIEIKIFQINEFSLSTL